MLAGGKLLITLSNLMALNPNTGASIWQAEKAEPSYGTPAVATIGQIDVALTPAGACLRISDGKILATHLGEMNYCSPLVHDGVVYYVGAQTLCLRG